MLLRVEKRFFSEEWIILGFLCLFLFFLWFFILCLCGKRMNLLNRSIYLAWRPTLPRSPAFASLGGKSSVYLAWW
jgi:hypothetical protein